MDEPSNILIVDDDPKNILALEAILESLGCKLTSVTTGREALRLLLNSSYAVILLDVRIPDMSGFEIAQLLRSHPRWGRTPIIFLTAFEEGAEKVFESYALGGVDYIVKPFDPRILRAKVQVFVELHQKTEAVRRETERRIRAEELAALAQELARSNAELEQFATVASHDLQEPLRTITSYAGLIAKDYGDAIDDRGRMYLDFVKNSAIRMKQMVDGLLYYARIGHHGRPFERVDTAAVFSEVSASMRVMTEETGARVTSADLPEVMGDRIELTRVFQNLLSNAIKFKSDRAPEVHVSAVRSGGEWRFSVGDNGIGIDPKHLQRIFAVFQRLHPMDRYQGTGIGLSECKKIIERHGGRIWVESRPNEGSTFYFTLKGRA